MNMSFLDGLLNTIKGKFSGDQNNVAEKGREASESNTVQDTPLENRSESVFTEGKEGSAQDGGGE